MPKDPSKVTQKWSANSSAGAGSYVEGAEGFAGNPAALAAAKADTWSTRLAQPETKAKYIRGLNRTTGEDWKRSIREKGASRFASGVQAAQPKYQAFAQEFLPFQEGITNAVRAMPKTNLEQGIARAAEQIRRTAAFRKGR